MRSYLDQYVFVVNYLKMWTRYAFGYLTEQRLLYFDKLWRIDHIQDLLNFTQEHHLLLGACLGPKFEQATHHRLGEEWILL